MVVHGKLAVVVAFALTSLSTIVVALRFYCRYFLVRKLGVPDWVMFCALITTWLSAVVTYNVIYYQDYSRVHGPEDWELFRKIVTGSLLSMWTFRLVYMFNHFLIKLSILIFYSHIASAHRTFHLMVRFMIALVVLASVGMMIASILTCHPVADAWSYDVFFDSFKGIRQTQCYDPTPLWLFSAGFNLGSDAFIWILPIPFLLNLRSMPVKRRIELSAIFSVGIIAVVASAVRLSVTVRWLSNWIESGQQWGNLLIWSQVEVHAGIIAACIPFLRPLVRKMLRATKSREGRHSPGPAAKLIGNITPENVIQPRTPIIPSPVHTFQSDRIFRPPPSPLTPIRPEIHAIQTV